LADKPVGSSSLVQDPGPFFISSLKCNTKSFFAHRIGELTPSRSEGASYRREDSFAMGSLRGEGVVMSNYGLLLRDHVTLRCRSIDRIFLQAYVPRLQAVGEVCTFLRWQRKFPIPSSAAFGKIGEEYVTAVHRFAEANGIPVVYFKKGQNKEEVAGPDSASCG
jgi:hypothetical protein